MKKSTKSPQKLSLKRYKLAIRSELAKQNDRIWTLAEALLKIDRNNPDQREWLERDGRELLMNPVEPTELNREKFVRRSAQEEQLVRCSLALACNQLAISSDEKDDIEETIGLMLVAESAVGMSKQFGVTAELNSIHAHLHAKKRHAETYSMKKEVLDYWQEKIDPTLSNERAAKLLGSVFPLSHRKLSQYVAEAKKGLRPAGRA